MFRCIYALCDNSDLWAWISGADTAPEILEQITECKLCLAAIRNTALTEAKSRKDWNQGIGKQYRETDYRYKDLITAADAYVQTSGEEEWENVKWAFSLLKQPERAEQYRTAAIYREVLCRQVRLCCSCLVYFRDYRKKAYDPSVCRNFRKWMEEKEAAQDMDGLWQRCRNLTWRLGFPF